MANENYEGFDLTIYNLFTLLREMYYTRGETETNFLQKSGGVVSGSLTIQGNLVVNGQSYSIDTENLKVGDYTITLAKDNEQTLTSMVGMVVPKYDGTNYGFFGWDADGYAYVGDLTNYDGTSAITLANNSSLQRISTIDTTNTVVASNGVIYVYDATSHCFKKPTNDNKYYVIRNGAFVETELFTEQKSKNINNALYNIGAFDTISGNTITRQTGYVDLSKLTWAMDSAGYFYTSSLIGLISTSVNTNVKCAIYTTENQQYLSQLSNLAISNDGSGYIQVRDDSCTTLDNFKAKINGIILQYKLNTTYTENIIPNQPLLNLDSNGCNFLREEWEKGLNLLPNSANRSGQNVSIMFDVNIEAGKTYTFSIQSGTNSGAYSLWLEMNGTNVQEITASTGVGSKKTFTATANANKLGLYPNNINNANIMLNLGSHAYPYQEYNGEIVREKDIEPVLLWENSSPTSSFAETTINNLDLSNFKYIVVLTQNTTTSSSRYCHKIAKVISNETTPLTMLTYWSGTNYLETRNIKITSNSSITISDNYTNASLKNHDNIPIAIYGTNVL